MSVIQTDRLILRRLTEDDADHILELLNDPAFIRFIGDKGVRTLDDARRYILNGPAASYEKYGFGLYLTELREGGTPVGICGLIKRDALEHVDVGFAFLPGFRSKGYAFESASAAVAHGKRDFGLTRIAGIVSPDNHASIRVLEKLGLRFERMIRLTSDEPEVMLFAGDV
ncbi:MAG: GNAT family N-acetyltransferase [Polyangiaceae bacterium]|nr:GNAT family N-acetyltransferase [Polyangiaceae bacterium]